MFVVIFVKTMYKKTIIRFGFCDIRNSQGLGKCYQPSARLITLTTILIIPDITRPHPIIVYKKYFKLRRMKSLFIVLVRLTRPQSSSRVNAHGKSWG